MTSESIETGEDVCVNVRKKKMITISTVGIDTIIIIIIVFSFLFFFSCSCLLRPHHPHHP